jgi:hypothetical protein
LDHRRICPPPELPSIQVTAGFGDSPLVGDLILVPVPNEGPWQYQVDLDRDGTIEFAALLSEAVALPYRFEEVGVHFIRVRLIHEQTELTVDEFAVVNDPSALTVQQVVFDPSISPPRFEGIAASRDGQFVYASKARRETILRLRVSDLVVEDSIDIGDLEETGVLEGLAVSPDDRRLFVVDKFNSLTALSVPDLAIMNHFPDVAESYFVAAETEAHAVVSGVSGRIARIDVDTGQVIAERRLDAYHFAHAPDGQTIAVSIDDSSEDGSGVHLLNAEDFGDVWSTPLPELRPWAIAFHPSGDRIYLFASKAGAMWLAVLKAENGQIQREFCIEPEVGSAIGRGVANPAAVAASELVNVFFIASGASIVKVTLLE